MPATPASQRAMHTSRWISTVLLLLQVVLCTRWPTQLSLRLSGVLLLALLEPGLLFAEDITVVRPGGQFDAEHVARWD